MSINNSFNVDLYNMILEFRARPTNLNITVDSYFFIDYENLFYFRNPMFVNYIRFKIRKEGAFQYNVSFK